MTTQYKLLADQCHYEVSEDGSVGEIVLVESSSGQLSSLPALYSPFVYMGASNALCTLRRIRREYLEKDARVVKYRLSYSSQSKQRDSNKGMASAIPTDTTERNWSYGGEFVSISEPVGWTWMIATTAIETESRLGLGKTITMVNFSIPTGDMDETAYSAFKSTILACGGRVNNGDFDGWGAGMVLCNGAEGGSTKNEAGTRVYRFNVSFTVRIVPEKSTDGWQYILRPDGVWDVPLRNGAKPYAEADFSALFPSEGE